MQIQYNYGEGSILYRREVTLAALTNSIIYVYSCRYVRDNLRLFAIVKEAFKTKQKETG